MSRARAVIAGASWLYTAQLGTIAVQFVYAAITSRNVNSSGFGAYAVALSVSAFVTLIANGGLGQTVARIEAVDRSTLRALVFLALLLGSAAAALMIATAGFWSWFWGTPAATTPIRWLAVSAFLAPSVGLGTGFLRRTGRFRVLAYSTLAANLTGMAVGAMAVTTWRTSSSLLVSPIVAQAILVASTFALSRGMLFGFASLSHARDHLGFSWRVTVSTIVAYIIGNFSGWTTARVFGTSTLGQWNRAGAITTVPFTQIQSAMIQAVYPEFRHDTHGADRARRLWPDLLTLVAWVTFPVAAVGAVLAPVVAQLLFGQGWDLAATLTAALSLIGGFQVVTIMLASAVEAIGRFRWMWLGQVAQFVVVAAGAMCAFALHEFAYVIAGIGAGLITLHFVHVIMSIRAGYMDAGKLAIGYLSAVTAAAIVAAVTALGIAAISRAIQEPWLLVLFITTVVGVGASVTRWRRLLPPIRIAQATGILHRKESVS